MDVRMFSGWFELFSFNILMLFQVIIKFIIQVIYAHLRLFSFYCVCPCRRHCKNIRHSGFQFVILLSVHFNNLACVLAGTCMRISNCFAECLHMIQMIWMRSSTHIPRIFICICLGLALSWFSIKLFNISC